MAKEEAADSVQWKKPRGTNDHTASNIQKAAEQAMREPPSKSRLAAMAVSPFPERAARREKGEGAQRLRGMPSQ